MRRNPNAYFHRIMVSQIRKYFLTGYWGKTVAFFCLCWYNMLYKTEKESVAMEAPQKFRKAFNGFHREDVVRYLEFLNARHQAQVNQLNLEIETLRNQAAQAAEQPDPAMEAERESLKARLEECQALGEELKAELARKDEELEQLRLSLRESEEDRQKLDAERASLEAQRASLEEQASVPLDAYRHAQSLERESRNRAELVYFQTSGVLNQASGKVDEAAQEITALADQAAQALTRLQMAVSGSKQTLQDASALMKSIRPNS